jgi:hypothetical protein
MKETYAEYKYVSNEPTITDTSWNPNKQELQVNLNEQVFKSANGSGDLDVDSFKVTLGTTIVEIAYISVVGSENLNYVLGFYGRVSAAYVDQNKPKAVDLIILPKSDKSIYNQDGTPMTVDSQTNSETNSITLYSRDIFPTTAIITCFAKNTLISMADGSFKCINKIESGDNIIDKSNKSIKVKRLQIGNYGEKTTFFNNGTKVVLIKKNALGNSPSQDTYITRSHPVYVNNKFVWAESLINNDTVQWITIADDIFYNIECEEGNTFIANGLIAGDTSVCNIDYKMNHSIITKINEISSYFTLTPKIF